MDPDDDSPPKRHRFFLVRAARCDNATREPLRFAAVFFLQREISVCENLRWKRPLTAEKSFSEKVDFQWV